MKLFYDDEFDALQQMIAGSDREFKHCASFLWPNLKPETSYQRLKTCVNPHGDQRLEFGQIIALAKFCDRFDVLHHMCDELLHGRPERKTPENEAARVARNFSEAVASMRECLDRAERLGLPLGMRAVK